MRQISKYATSNIVSYNRFTIRFLYLCVHSTSHALGSMCLVITGNICFDRDITTLYKRSNRFWIHNTDPLFDVCDISSELIKTIDNRCLWSSALESTALTSVYELLV